VTTHRDIHDIAEELTRQHTHRERYEYRDKGTLWKQDHVTLVPALIDQLEGAQPQSQNSEGGGGFGSRPAARIEALDTLALIDHAASAWVRKLGHDDPGSTKACVTKLHGLHAGQDEVTRKAIERDMRGWWTQARIVSGWDVAAWRPDNSCPMCDVRRSLRVKIIDMAAFCVECRETWDETTIGLLADHIRAENGEDELVEESS
jgi:hypothetical protein